MIEVEFRKLVVLTLPRTIDGLRVWNQNSGKIIIPATKGSPKRAFDAGPPTGAADVSGILSPEGVRVEIELKSPTALLTAEQRMWGEAIKRLGGIYVLFRMETIDGEKELPRCVEAVRAAVDEFRDIHQHDDFFADKKFIHAVVLLDGRRIESGEKYTAVYMDRDAVYADHDDGQCFFEMDEVESIIVNNPEAALKR